MPAQDSNWTPVPRLVEAGAFGRRGREGTRARRARRWAARLGAALAERRGGEWHVSPDAQLPDGQRVAMFFEHGARPDMLGGHVLPPGAGRWSEPDRQRFLNTHMLLERFGDFAAARPTMTEEGCAAVFAAGPDGAWAAERGLSCNYRTLERYRERLTPGSAQFDGNVDRRGRKLASDEARAARFAPELQELTRGLYLQESRLNALEVRRTLVPLAKANGWALPAKRTFQKWIKDNISHADKVLGRRGVQAFRAEVLPKLHRDLSGVPAGFWWVADVRYLDIWSRVRDHSQGWRPCRLKLTAIMDVRSRMMVGWCISERADTNTILAAFMMAVSKYGAPDHITLDNGKDFIAAAGGRGRRRWDSWDEARLGTAFQQLKVTVHYAEVRAPWAKSIERAFATLANIFDKTWPSYAGPSAAAKPSGIARIRANVMDLPTVEDITNAWEQEALADYHARTHEGDSMNGLTPNLAMEQYRGTIRRVSAAVLDFVCSRIVGPKTVGRDGIRHRGILYGNYDARLIPYLGRKVMLRMRPDRADTVIMCDLEGRPLLEINNAVLNGLDQADVKKAAELRRREVRDRRKFIESSRAKLESLPQTARRLKAQESIRSEAALRQHLAPPPAPAVTLVGADLEQDVKGMSKRRPAAAQEDPEVRAIRDIMAQMEEMASQYDLGNEAGTAAARRRADADLADFADMLGDGPRREVAG